MQTSTEQITIAERLWIPIDTQAILWDMDGVLIDSLSLDLVICNQFLAQRFGNHVTISTEFIRSLFAYDPVKFWEFILAFVKESYDIPNASRMLDTIVHDFNQARHNCVFKLNPGIADILEAVKASQLKMAVISNNPTQEVKETLSRSGILEYFDTVVGNDIQDIAKKPAPDSYLLGANLLGVEPEKCAVIEDSLVGVEAGSSANCYPIGVATGGADFAVLERSQLVQQVYTSFARNSLALQFGDVTKKKIITPNEFISHAIEHIAWRLGVEITLDWYNNNWWTLGEIIGKQIRTFPIQCQSTAALGMIDDGSAEIIIEITDIPALQLSAVENVDLQWFLGLRCEQLLSGDSLVELIQGLAHGLEARIAINICSVEDPHHTWEGVFRAIGIGLSKIFAPKQSLTLTFDSVIEEEIFQESELIVLTKSAHYSKVWRGTAESHVVVAVDFTKQHPNSFTFKVAPSINVSELPRLLEIFAIEAGFTMQVEFIATVLSSSHVVLEDTALVLGRALLEVLSLRMERWGVNGAGSSIVTLQDLETQPIRVGISVEGRKFWKFVPFRVPLVEMRQKFIIGQNVYDHLHSEDLDDFLDGLAGGLACSIIIHIEELIEPNTGWQLIFQNLGKAFKEVLAFNPYRKGVPPGVKATLA